MKKHYFLFLLFAVCSLTCFAQATATQSASRQWDFTKLSASDKEQLESHWSLSGNYFTNDGINVGKYSKEGVDMKPEFYNVATAIQYATPLMSNNKDAVELDIAKGLEFGFLLPSHGRFAANKKKGFRIYDNANGYGITPAIKDAFIVIPKLKKSDVVTIITRNFGKEARGLKQIPGYKYLSGFEKNSSTKEVTNKLVVLQDGDLAIYVDGQPVTFISIEVHNDPTSVKGLHADKQNKDGKVYNLSGQYMGKDLNACPKGIYVIDGKKVIKK